MITKDKTVGWAEVIDNVKHYPLHSGQKKVLLSNTRFTLASAGTGGGKTVIGPLWLIKQIERVMSERPKGPKGLYMVLAPTYKVLMRATIPCLLETLKGTGLEGKWNASNNLYTLPDEAKIWCQGADNPGGLEGGQFDAIWGDEAGQFKNSVWIAIQGRTGQKQAPILFTTTPYIRNWLYTDVYKKFMAGDKNYFVVTWSSTLNPSYPVEEYERAKGSMGIERAQMRYDGLWLQPEGLVYKDFEKTIVDEPLENIFEFEGRYVGGIDFGWNDPFCALCGKLDRNDVLWIWYERYKSECSIDIHADSLPKIKNNPIRWYCDPSEPSQIYRLRKGGHKVRKAIRSILTGIDAVNGRIRSGRLKVNSNCRCLITESELYSFPEKDEEIVGDKPVDKNNHAMDALRYLIMGIDAKLPA